MTKKIKLCVTSQSILNIYYFIIISWKKMISVPISLGCIKYWKTIRDKMEKTEEEQGGGEANQGTCCTGRDKRGQTSSCSAR